MLLFFCSYRKFTRGKDVNKYSAKDLANIFGKKDLSDPAIKKEIIKEEKDEESVVGTEDKTGGVLTYKGGNMADYFKNKLGSFTGLSKKPSDDNEDDDDQRYVGFGFGFSSTNDLENNKIDSKPSDNTIESPKKKKIKKNKNITEGFVNDALDLEIKVENEIDIPISCDNFEVKRVINGLENNGLDLTDETVDKQHVTSNNNLELTSKSLKKKKSKRKLDKIEAEGFVNSALDLDTKVVDIKSETPLSCDDFEVSRANFGLENNGLDLTDEKTGKRRVTFNDKLEFNTDSSKKKKKTKAKLDKFEVDNEKLKKKEKKKKKKNKEQDVVLVEDNVFINEALDVEIVNEEVNDNEANEKKNKKSKRKRDRRMSNLETIEETPEEESSQNSNDKDKLEPPKKKKKNNITETVDVNETSSQTPSQIAKQDDNDVIEIISLEGEKKKKNKKKNKKTDDIEIMEIMEIDDNKEDLKINSKENNKDTTLPDKKKSKKNKKNKSKNQQIDDEQINKENNEEKQTKIDEIKNTVAKIPNNNKSTTSEAPKTHKMFKKLFAKTPVINFNGSNINDIKGYGIDV